MIRPCDESEMRHVLDSERLYRMCWPIAMRFGILEAFNLPNGSGRMYRSGRGGWRVHPTTHVLTTDTLVEHDQSQDRPATEDAVHVADLLTESINRGSPAFDPLGRLIRIDVPWGRLELAADGEGWICRQEDDPEQFDLVTVTLAPEADRLAVENDEGPLDSTPAENPAPRPMPASLEGPADLAGTGTRNEGLPRPADRAVHGNLPRRPRTESTLERSPLASHVAHRGRGQSCPLCGGGLNRDRTRPVYDGTLNAHRPLQIRDEMGAKQVQLSQTRFRTAPRSFVPRKGNETLTDPSPSGTRRAVALTGDRPLEPVQPSGRRRSTKGRRLDEPSNEATVWARFQAGLEDLDGDERADPTDGGSSEG